MRRWMVIGWAAVALLPACRKKPSDGGASQQPQPLLAAEAMSDGGAPSDGAQLQSGVLVDGCSQINCGSNSAVVNDSPLGTLLLDGQSNDNGFSIDPVLYPRDGAAGAELRLDVRGGQIVGVDGNGEVAAAGDELKDRWFRLRQRPAWGTSKVLGKIRITDVAFVRLLAHRRSNPEVLEEEEVAVGYELEYEPESNARNARATHLCSHDVPLSWPNEVARVARRDASLGVRGRSGHSPLQASVGSLAAGLPLLPRPARHGVSRELPLDTRVKLIFVLKGEAYGEWTAGIQEMPEALTLACPDTALSKMKLMGYDPQDPQFPTTREQRLAVLKMLTARYCDATSFTVDGQPLYWENRSQWFSSSPGGAVEALWNEHGAICLNQPRRNNREEIIRHCGRELPLCGAGVSESSVPAEAELVSIVPADPGAVKAGATAAAEASPAPPAPPPVAVAVRRSR